ncbi:hypothetical protein MSAN_02374300 [Mycena sanguinolenta]|uniref:Uncharacterized protein n=1 Tax=Mycena sanguinolenta TaxID=230812 RepID=A0A8H6X5B4_9AGAR|nr:hypothetical protein MSAN_02374300 [Mycena sanguinolenta]
MRDRGTKVIAFSKECTGEARLNGCCSHCAKIPAEVHKLVDLAVQADSRVNHRYLSWNQIRQLLADRTEELRKWRLKSLNQARNFATAVRKLADYKRFMEAVAEMNIPRLQQLVSVGIRRGSSPLAIIRMMQSALEGVYRPRPVLDSRTLDIALMVYRLGGRKLLYAVNHGLGLPSLRSLRNHMAFTKVMPTVGELSPADIIHNIREVVFKPRQAAAVPPPLRGVSLLIDEISLEERACHFRHNNSVGGLCWRHSPKNNLQLKTYEDALKIAADIKAGNVHLGKEMTVVSVSCFGESGTYPILALPTCKFIDPAESNMIYETVTETWLPDQSADSVQRLLFPDDPQDVPRAVELMESIIDLLACDFGPVTADAAADLDSIRLLALILKSILAPFITPDMSLTEQMTHLSTYAHLTFTLFRMNRLTFMSNQLYGDSQSMIKNAFFCLAKQQKLDPTQPFYLFQVGDDALEKLFGKLRMLGGHNSAMSYAQAIERLGHACDLQAVYLRQPDLDQGQRRISMKRSEGVDHLNMASWTGHAVAGDCHLLSAWNAGCKLAQEILVKLRFPPHSYDYVRIFSNPEIDMLRPVGDGKYPGVESDTDRSIIVPQTTVMPSSSQDVSLPVSAPSTSPPTLSTSSTSVSAPSPSAPTSAPIQSASAVTPSCPSAVDGSPMADADDDDIEEQGDGIPFEDTLDEIPELALPSGRGVDPSDYLNVEGKWVHKQRICRVVINADFEPKSTERLKRVRGHTKVNSKKRDDVNPEAILGANTFIVGDPFFTLLRTDQTLSLAVVRSTAIHEDGISCGSILSPTIRNPTAKVKLSGQVLGMTMIPTLDEAEYTVMQPRPPSHPGLRSPDWISEDKSPWSWIWNGRFLKVDSAIAGTRQTMEKVVVVSVPGVLTELVNHRPVDAVPRLGDLAYQINSEGRSWELEDGPMGAVCELLWEAVVNHKVPLTSIASVKKSMDFPYAFDDGKPALVCQEGTQQLIQQHDAKVQRTCHLCGERPNNWRAHISTHILRSIRGVKEALRGLIGTSLPCGFCACSGKRECEVYVRKKGPTTHVETNCPMVSAFNYKPADQGSRATPCRNVPVVCTLCFSDPPRPNTSQRAQWRYNMPEHIATAHPEYSSPLSPGGTRLPYEVWESMKVGEDEELALGIPKASIPGMFADVAGPDEGVDRSNTASECLEALIQSHCDTTTPLHSIQAKRFGIQRAGWGVVGGKGYT